MSSHASRHDESIRGMIGRNIRAGRAARGLTQRELAVLLDTDVMQISRWERGKTRPNADNEARIARVLFGSEVAHLYGEAAA